MALHLRARVLEDRLIFLDGRECLAPFLRPRAVDRLAHFRLVLLHLRGRGLDLRLPVRVLEYRDQLPCMDAVTSSTNTSRSLPLNSIPP